MPRSRRQGGSGTFPSHRSPALQPAGSSAPLAMLSSKAWPRVVTELKRRGYAGDYCLPAEYHDEPAVDRLVAEDLLFARSLIVEGE